MGKRGGGATWREQATYNQGQSSPALGVDKKNSRDRSHDLDGAVAQGGVQGLGSRVADVLKDGRAVERNDCRDVRPTV